MAATTVPAAILRDAMLRMAPQDEVWDTFNRVLEPSDHALWVPARGRDDDVV